MKKTFKTLGIIALVAVIVFALAACGNGSTEKVYKVGDTGPGGGIVFYDKGNDSGGWRYLEAAPGNQGTSIEWCSCSSFSWCDVTGAAETAIGKGKANTAAIIAAHSDDTPSNNAAKAATACTSGDKTDWFLPSKYELDEMYNSHLGIGSDHFWASSQYNSGSAWNQVFDNTGSQQYHYKDIPHSVHAVRAF